MLRRFAEDRDAGVPDGPPTVPMTESGAIATAPPAAQAAVARADALRERLRAAAVHLAISAAIALAACAAVFGLWYPQPLDRVLGVGTIVLIMLGIDVVLGPLFTLIVFDRRKKRLAWDLATIGALQLVALLYGVYTIERGRPAFVVFVKDRFEVVSPADLRPDDRAAARANPFAVPDPLRPRWVAARMPDSAQERDRIMFEAVGTGRDVQHHPALYVDYSGEARAVLERALPISRLRAFNGSRLSELDAAIAATGRDAASLRYLPLRGAATDGAVLIDAADARVIAVTALAPW